MLTNARYLKDLVVGATDGDIGRVDNLYFDDETWVVRYVTAETGSWLGGRQVLISPFSVIKTNWQDRRLEVSLTKKQIAGSPDIDTERPVSRQHEAAYLGYFGYPYYWGGPYMWGPALCPSGVPMVPIATTSESMGERIQRESLDSHLRSADAVKGYRIEAVDGEIGHVDGFIVDDENWSIRYMELATRNWWPGKKVLVSPAWIKHVSWAESTVHVRLTREAVQTAPQFDESAPITREYEDLLHKHYDQAPYWIREVQSEASRR